MSLDKFRNRGRDLPGNNNPENDLERASLPALDPEVIKFLNQVARGFKKQEMHQAAAERAATFLPNVLKDDIQGAARNPALITFHYRHSKSLYSYYRLSMAADLKEALQGKLKIRSGMVSEDNYGDPQKRKRSWVDFTAEERVMMSRFLVRTDHSFRNYELPARLEKGKESGLGPKPFHFLSSLDGPERRAVFRGLCYYKARAGRGTDPICMVELLKKYVGPETVLRELRSAHDYFRKSGARENAAAAASLMTSVLCALHRPNDFIDAARYIFTKTDKESDRANLRMAFKLSSAADTRRAFPVLLDEIIRDEGVKTVARLRAIHEFAFLGTRAASELADYCLNQRNSAVLQAYFDVVATNYQLAMKSAPLILDRIRFDRDENQPSIAFAALCWVAGYSPNAYTILEEALSEIDVGQVIPALETCHKLYFFEGNRKHTISDDYRRYRQSFDTVLLRLDRENIIDLLACKIAQRRHNANSIVLYLLAQGHGDELYSEYLDVRADLREQIIKLADRSRQ